MDGSGGCYFNEDSVDNMDVRGCSLHWMHSSGSTSWTNTTIDYIHSVENGTGDIDGFATHYTEGSSAGYSATGAPAAGSTLLDRVPRFIPVDINNHERDATTAVGAFRGPSEGLNTPTGAAPIMVAALL